MNELAIIIPAYKEKFLNKTLSSLVKQTNKSFNVYIGDDQSPYPLQEIVKKYKNTLSITYKKFETNLGRKNLVLQWKRCIELTSNEKWLWLFSDDDELSENCIENFYKYKKIYPSVHLFHFDVQVINEKSEIIQQCNPYPHKLTSIDFYKMKMRGNIQSYVVENLFSRSLYMQCNGFEEFDLAWGSDTATWIKMIGNKELITIPDSYVKWRKSSENLTPNFSKEIMIRKANALIAFFNWTFSYFSWINIQQDNKIFFVNRMKLYVKYINSRDIIEIITKFSNDGQYSLFEKLIISTKLFIYKIYAFFFKQ
jgi:hypothetical protein